MSLYFFVVSGLGRTNAHRVSCTQVHKFAHDQGTRSARITSLFTQSQHCQYSAGCPRTFKSVVVLPSAGIKTGQRSKRLQKNVLIEYLILLAKASRDFVGVPYPQSSGGSVAMKPEHWLEANGFSNDYLGWGGEDDELFHRFLRDYWMCWIC